MPPPGWRPAALSVVADAHSGAFARWWRGEGSLTGSKRLILPDTCPDRDSGWSFCRSGRYSRRSAKPSAQPTLVRTRHLPPLLAGEVAPIKTTLAAATQRHKPCRRCSADTSLLIPGCLVCVLQGDPAHRSSTSTGAPEQPVLDGRSQPDSQRPRIPNGGSSIEAAEIDSQAVIRSRDAGQLLCSDGERRVLELAASLAGHRPVILGDAITGLDNRSVHALVRAVLHSSGQRQFP
jgi:hypothetical protein